MKQLLMNLNNIVYSGRVSISTYLWSINNNQLFLPGKDHLSKLQPQNYARKDQPVFTIKTEGPPQNTRYKATVVIDGKSFESPTFFNTIKEAEEAAINIVHMFQQVSVLVISYVILNYHFTCIGNSYDELWFVSYLFRVIRVHPRVNFWN